MKRNLILTTILLFQVALIAGLYLSKKEYGAFSPEEKLLSFNPVDIDTINLAAAGEQPLTLKKGEKGWYIPSYFNFPCNQANIDDLFKKLGELKKGWPVAVSSDSAERFQVDENNFVRHITLKNGDKVKAELFLGSAPSFRKSHARASGSDDIVVVEFSDFDAEARPDDWFDRDVLKPKPEEITGLTMPDFSLQKDGDDWIVKDLAEGESSVKEETKKLLEKISGLTMESVLGPDNKPEYQQDMPELVFSLQTASGEQVTYTFSKPKNDEHYVLKSSRNENYFKVILWMVDAIKEFNRGKVVSNPNKETVSEQTEIKEDTSDGATGSD
ncbi:MAG: DUF4340 domain-containing protein [Desulfobulbaceae bacterium]|nr:DUF4340 domain-containing protein [Desulfobulbaceae bacterium]